MSLVVDETFSEGRQGGWEGVRVLEGGGEEREGGEDVREQVGVQEGRLRILKGYIRLGVSGDRESEDERIETG